MTERVLVAGVGMTRFRRPSEGTGYVELAADAIARGLADSGMSYEDLQQAYVGYSYGDSTCGQRVLYDFGLTGIPIVNVNNNCATGSSALFLARQAIASGAADCVLALGFEQMGNGALSAHWSDRQQPLEQHVRITRERFDDCDAPWAARWFGGAGIEYMERYGTRPETFGKIAEKSRRHAADNPNAVFRLPLTLDQIMESPTIYGPLTRLQCCPPTSGAAMAVVVSADFARRRLGHTKLVEIVGQAMTSDPSGAFNGSMISLVGFDMAHRAAQHAYLQAGVEPGDIDVIELHDCFTTNELIAYESLGLADAGQGERLVTDGDNTYGGKYVVNPSGGLLSKGHPLGATGLAQCAELVWQLRGSAGRRQVPGARIALQHNLGLGGACVVTVYKAA